MSIPIQVPTVTYSPSFTRRYRWVCFAKAILAVLTLVGMEKASAYSFTCAGSSSMASPFPGRIVDSTTQDGTVIFSGNMFVLLNSCKNNSSPGSTSFNVLVPTDSVGTSLLGVSGITVASTALPSYSISSVSGGTCTLGTKTYSGGSTYITFNHPIGAVCNYQITFPLSLTMHVANGSIAGSVGADLTSLAPLLGGHGWVLYSGASNDLLGYSSTLDLMSTVCTLTTPNVTVTLPKVSVSALGSGMGATAGRTPFTVALGGCSNLSPSYIAKANWTFADGVGPTSIANSAATNPASNVYVQLLDSAFIPVSNGGTSTLAQVSGGVATSVQHYAQYYAGGVVGVGKVTGVATLNLSYE